MPNELIYRDSVIEKLQAKFPDEGWDRYMDGISDAADIVEDEPAVDAAPVLYAHWIPRDPTNPESRYYYCSGCKAEINKAKTLYFRFCPECGAIMNKSTKSMSAEDLKAILQKHYNTDNSELDYEVILPVLAEIALREGKSSESEAKEAWQRFTKYWLTGARDISRDVFSVSSDFQE